MVSRQGAYTPMAPCFRAEFTFDKQQKAVIKKKKNGNEKDYK